MIKDYINRGFLLPIFVLLGVVLSCSVQAQDLLITIHNDSLNCKVGKLTDDFYPIQFMLDDRLMNGTIHKDSVSYYRKNIFRSLDDDRLRLWYPKVSLGIDAGGGCQFGQLRVGLTEDLEPRKGSVSDRNVFYAGADVAVYLTARTGYGLKYHYRHMLGGDIRQNYVGPMIAFRFWDKKQENHWLLHFSVGYGRMAHTDALIKVGTRDPEPVKLTANALAGDITVGYNLKLSRHVSTRFKLSATMAYPNHVRIFDYTGVNPGGAGLVPDISGYCQNMNSINLSVGFGFH